jgi:hypothetical protein
MVIYVLLRLRLWFSYLTPTFDSMIQSLGNQLAELERAVKVLQPEAEDYCTSELRTATEIRDLQVSKAAVPKPGAPINSKGAGRAAS